MCISFALYLNPGLFQDSDLDGLTSLVLPPNVTTLNTFFSTFPLKWLSENRPDLIWGTDWIVTLMFNKSISSEKSQKIDEQYKNNKVYNYTVLVYKTNFLKKNLH